MANRAYLRVWTRNFSEQTMIAEFARFLTTAPVPDPPNGFRLLSVQPVDYTEPSEVEWDLSEATLGPPEIAALAMQHLNADTAFIVEAHWNLWNFDPETLRWDNAPQPLTLLCHGTAFDSGAAATEGQFVADLGFEHLFTGHAGLLAPGAASNPFAGSDHPVEKRFRAWMGNSENLRQYHQRTRENIQTLFGWVEAIQAALPVERSVLTSEGEENFEARLDAILAQR
ncbi:MAG TPA: hypothetical protein VL128_16810 [Candidatus Eisenbacteria bacterium]|nr:hypothetical protein [Candidatus Eisenbacteria bacterium]